MRFVLNGPLVVEADDIKHAMKVIALYFAISASDDASDSEPGDWVQCGACGDDVRHPGLIAEPGTNVTVHPEGYPDGKRRGLE